MSKNESNDFIYDLSLLFGKGIGLSLRIFFGVMFCGLKAAGSNIILLIIYVFLSILLFIQSSREIAIYLLIFIAGGAGIHMKVKQYPYKKRIKYFNDIFSIIQLQTSDKCLPLFLYEEQISDFCIVLAFQSLIPISVWKGKKEELEVYFNQKIVDIKQDYKNNRTVYLVVQVASLPTYIEWNQALIADNDSLSLGIGFYGIAKLDLTKYPHTFIAGETGSGKSNLLKCLIEQSLNKDYDVILIDFKRGVSFSDFDDFLTIAYEYDSAKIVLENMVEETKKRLDLFRKFKVDNLIDYNKKSSKKLERSIIFIDELAELLKVNDKEIKNSLYTALESLTRLSRAVGIHLIMGIQRPDSTVVNGQIKSNVTFRICGHFADKEPSYIMLANDLASKLDDVKGRFIVKANDTQEIQAFFYKKTFRDMENQKKIETMNTFQNEKPQLDNNSDIFDFNFSDISKNLK